MIASPFGSVLLGTGALGCALNAGVFFAFSSFVMPAFDRLPPEQATAAMQSINVVVVQSALMPLLFGTALLGSVAAVGSLRYGYPARVLICAGALVYLVGCIGVTSLGNVPLNDTIARVRGAEAAAYWPGFSSAWVTWNSVRTAACTGAPSCSASPVFGRAV